MRRRIDFALDSVFEVQRGGRNSTQQSRSDEVDSSAESWPRAGVFAEEIGSLSPMGGALRAQSAFSAKKSLKRPNRTSGLSDRGGE